MPRTSVNKTKNNIRDFSGWVVGRMALNNMNQSEVADYLNLDQPSLSNRIHGKTDWKLREVFELYLLFGETYEFKK